MRGQMPGFYIHQHKTALNIILDLMCVFRVNMVRKSELWDVLEGDQCSSQNRHLFFIAVLL